MIENNNVELLFEARSENEAFARVVARQPLLHI